MSVMDVEYYAERRDLSLDVLSYDLVRQLSHLTWRVLATDGRESSYVDDDDCFVKAKIARLDGLALVEANGKVEGYLNEQSDVAGFQLKAKRRMFYFAADDFGVHGDWRLCPVAPPDIWYNAVATPLSMRVDRYG